MCDLPLSQSAELTSIMRSLPRRRELEVIGLTLQSLTVTLLCWGFLSSKHFFFKSKLILKLHPANLRKPSTVCAESIACCSRREGRELLCGRKEHGKSICWMKIWSFLFPLWIRLQPPPLRTQAEILRSSSHLSQTRKCFEDPDAHPELNHCLFYGPSAAVRTPGLNFKSQPSQLLLPSQLPIEIPASSPMSVSAMDRILSFTEVIRCRRL